MPFIASPHVARLLRTPSIRDRSHGEAKFYLYHQEIEKGGILVGVYAHENRVETARDNLNAAGDKVTKG